MIIADVLKTGTGSNLPGVVTCDAEHSVRVAVDVMASNNIGAVVVGDGERVAGVFSERDVVKGCHREGADFLDRTLNEVMIDQVLAVHPNDEVDDALSIMKQHGIRHLPVVEQEKLIGIVSLRDLSFSKIDSVSDKVSFLTSQVHIMTRPLPM